LDGEKSADARSILAVLTLAAVKGTEIEVITDGIDESAALSAVEELFKAGFGENS
jgi:phosphotransferase system HPr (HPr) family protein